MALSGFIKQLLETDTVFGSEAKKSTGINDASIRVYYPNVNVSFISNTTENTLDFVINNYTESLVPEWLIIDKYIKFDFEPVADTLDEHLGLIQYEERLFQISSVINDTVLNTLTMSFNPDAVGTPMFSLLTSALNVTGINVLIDGRIFKLIGDPDIAREASNGSTMFNLDNTISTPFQEADASGIASKYASHYHTDLVSDFIVHEKDDNGNTLVRVAIDSLGTTQTVKFNENTAATRASIREVNGDNTNVSFSDDVNVQEVAKYGRNATVLDGIFLQIDENTLPTDFGTGLSRSDGFIMLDGATDYTWVWGEESPAPNVFRWPDPGANPATGQTAESTSMETLATQLNVAIPLDFTFTYVGVVDGRETIRYRGNVPGTSLNIVPEIFNNGAEGERVFFDSANVLFGEEAKPLIDNEFFTESELIGRLKENTLGINIAESDGFIVFSSEEDGVRIISIKTLLTGDPVFENSDPNVSVFRLTLTTNTFKVRESPPDLVYDLEGDPVFGVPAFSVRRL